MFTGPGSPVPRAPPVLGPTGPKLKAVTGSQAQSGPRVPSSKRSTGPKLKAVHGPQAQRALGQRRTEEWGRRAKKWAHTAQWRDQAFSKFIKT